VTKRKTPSAAGEYLKQMLQRHPGLKMSGMAREAGVSRGSLTKLISGARAGARPKTLKALTDRWGTDEDYRELLKLTGHPVPEPIYAGLTADERALLAKYSRLSSESQAYVQRVIDSALEEDGEAGPG